MPFLRFIQTKKWTKNHSCTSIYENISTNTSNNTPETFENGIRKSKCRNVESSTKHIQTSFFGIQFNHTKMSEPYKQYFAFCQRLSDKHKTAHFQPRLAPFSPQFMEMEPVIPNTGASLSVGNRHRQFHCK